jgi:hypothetical protein
MVILVINQNEYRLGSLETAKEFAMECVEGGTTKYFGIFSEQGDEQGNRVLLHSNFENVKNIFLTATDFFNGILERFEQIADAPEVTAPEVTAPEVTAPEVTAPEVTAPEVETPLN